MSVCLKKIFSIFPFKGCANFCTLLMFSKPSPFHVILFCGSEKSEQLKGNDLTPMASCFTWFMSLFSSLSYFRIFFFFLVIIVLICCAICKISMLKLFVKLRENNTTVQGSHINVGRRRRRSLFPWQWSWPPSCEIQRPRRRMTLHVVSCQRRFSDSNISNDILLWFLICRK